MTRRVVITGMGTLNPVGHTVKETWESITHGVSGVAPITLFDPKEFLVKIACEVKNFDPGKYMDIKEARRRDRFEQFATPPAAKHWKLPVCKSPTPTPSAWL